MSLPNWLTHRNKEYAVIVVSVLALILSFLVEFNFSYIFLALCLLGGLPTFLSGIEALKQKYISVDLFNSLALLLTLFVGEFKSGVFIVLMLTVARILEEYTESQSHKAVEELLKLKPDKAYLETPTGKVQEVKVEDVSVGNTLVIKAGQRVPVDGKVTYGQGYINEASISGESKPLEKVLGDEVFAGTLLESGALKIEAIRVGADSTLEKMAVLVEEAGKNKSKTQKLADRFAGWFLPGVLVLGLVVYLLTKNVTTVISLFLVACADDIAVSIPLAMTASLGQAAKRGVIVKGGKYLDTLGRLKVLVFDKTGTLTMGKLFVDSVTFKTTINEKDFWYLVASAEKLSDHPMGKALFHHALEFTSGNCQDPEKFTTKHGQGITAEVKNKEIVIGNFLLAETLGLLSSADNHDKNLIFVFIDKQLQATLKIKDLPKPEAKTALQDLRALGVEKIVMFTGDNEETAKEIASSLGIDDYRARMLPQDKLKALEELTHYGPVGMVGDGINDAPALARSSVGIAMGSGGAAVAVEAADVVILTDNLSRLPEMVELGRRTTGVVYGDIWIWVITNAVGFILVFMGYLSPIWAAGYNFFTDFLPVINSLQLFKKKSSSKA